VPRGQQVRIGTGFLPAVFEAIEMQGMTTALAAADCRLRTGPFLPVARR